MFEKVIKSAKKDSRFFEVFYNYGPTDGGCLVFAKAMLLAFGPGKLVRITRDVGQGEIWFRQTEHYGVVIADRIIDSDGAHASANDWINSFSQQENLPIQDLHVAVGYDEDSEIPDDPAATKMLAYILSEHCATAA